MKKPPRHTCNQYIIISEDGDGNTCFYESMNRGWGPDIAFARVFPGNPDGREQAIDRARVLGGLTTEVVYSYGYNNQRSVWTKLTGEKP